MNRKKILVTGGAGYIGAHAAVELFEAGFEPVIVDDFSKSDRTLLDGIETITQKKPLLCEGNCTDKEFLTKVFNEHSISAVLHFAAYKSVGESVQQPLAYYQNNLLSLITVLEVMKDAGVTDFVFSSSCTVYGQPDQIPVSEHAPFKRAESPYGATKQMCERILEDTFLSGFRIVSLRYFNPVGAHPTALLGELPCGVPNNLVPYITQTAIGKRKQLIVFGNDYNTPDGSCVRDFIHVVDLAKAHIKALLFLAQKKGKFSYDVFNLGMGVGISVLELINKFEKTTGVRLNYSIGPRRAGDVEKTYAEPSKANQELNWKTEFSIEEALLHAWNWERKLSSNDKS
jgi:UDP-glucose 4-epimerase